MIRDSTSLTASRTIFRKGVPSNEEDFANRSSPEAFSASPPETHTVRFTIGFSVGGLRFIAILRPCHLPDQGCHQMDAVNF